MVLLILIFAYCHLHIELKRSFVKPRIRPIISVCDSPTERISSFVDTLLQPAIAQTQPSYIKDITDFINFLERTKIGQDTILVSMDVTSLYTNIPQEEGINIVCKEYEKFYKHNTNPYTLAEGNSWLNP